MEEKSGAHRKGVALERSLQFIRKAQTRSTGSDTNHLDMSFIMDGIFSARVHRIVTLLREVFLRNINVDTVKKSQQP